MNVFQRQHFTLGIGIALLAVILSFIFRDAFEGIEHGVLNARYHFRGESKIDSSVLIVYFDEGDIRALGGLPLKRSYYALIISALHNLGAKAIGVDVAFPEPNAEYPEYDEVLISVVRNTGNVVLGGYFKALALHASEFDVRKEVGVDTTLHRFSYQQQVDSHYFGGIDFVGPFPKLLTVASHLGHTNFDKNFQIPLFVRYGMQFVPSLSFELVRLSKYVEKTAVEISHYAVTVGSSVEMVSIPLEEHGILSLNYPGGLEALNALPALQLLKAYDAANRGEQPSFPLETVRGKIVLVGVIAEGRSSFVPTPFTPQFPAIGIHAVAVSNMLQQRFLKDTPIVIETIISLLLGFLALVGTNARREGLGIALIIGGMLLYILSCFVLFSLFDWLLPMVRPLFVILSTTTVLLFVKHQAVRRSLAKLEREKEVLAVQLQEKERHLKLLEHEFFESEKHRDQDRNTAILEEIRKYKREIHRLSSQVSDLQAFEFTSAKNADGVQSFEGIVYRADGPMASVVDFIKKIAPNDAAVLILGESGTGKELVARAIHRLSHRKDQPFVAVNCGALSETLLESELFGHEKGAFTGAVREKPGRFELANGGTIFLDEIGETIEAFQVKLLRVLQEGEFERVGGTTTLKVNVRVLAATNKELKKAVSEKQFREDLYYRLNTLTIQLPPLRERVGDIPVLVEHYISTEQPGVRVSTNVMETLTRYEWKGNVRELQSVVKRAVILARSDHRDIIRLKDLPDEVLAAVQDAFDIEDQILESLREKKFSRSAISETANELGGLNRGTVAEYFRGYCFKIFCEQQYHLDAAMQAIAQTTDPEVRDKVRKKINEYLSNAVELVKKEGHFENVQLACRPKFKNLPQRYHMYLEELLRSYHQGLWRLDGK